MLSLSQKHQKFLAEPMGDKKVTELPGIGKALGNKLEAAGFHKAKDVLDQYLDLEQCKDLFEKWLKDTCGANKKQSGDCYQCLSEWYKTWDEVAGEKKKGRETNAKRLTWTRSECQRRWEAVSGLRETKKGKEETEKESEEEEEESEYEEQIEEEEEEIEEEKTFRRNGKVRRSLGTSEEKTALAQKRWMEWREWEEERKRVLNNEIQAREREYRLTLELSEKVREMEEKMKRMEEKCNGFEKKIAEMEK